MIMIMEIMPSLYVTATITVLLAFLGHDTTLVHGGSSSGSGSGSGGSTGHHFPTVHGGGTITYTLGPTHPSYTSTTPTGSTGYSSPPSWTPWDGNARRHKGSGNGTIGVSSSMSPPTWRSPPTLAPPSVVQSNLSIFQMIVFAWIASCLALLTVLGNILVMVSFKIDKQLQTISNYFLFSLAMADFCVGLISMPLFTIHIIMGYWPFGPVVCDTWLALDYLVSNASVLNLLIISFDRYFSVTRPLTYRARRTTRRAAVMISSAWGISLVLWPPWIYAWPYIEGKRTVPEGKCYIQFIETNHYITFGTAIAAFYVPVSIMLWLYFKIWRETEKRQRDLSQLQAGKKESSRRSNSSDEVVDVEEWKRMRSESCICPDHLDQLSTCPAHQGQGSKLPRWCANRLRCFATLWIFCSSYCRVDRDPDDPEELEDEHVSPGCGTPASVETPLQSSVSRCTSLNVIRDPLALAGTGGAAQTPTRRTDVLVSSGVHLSHPATGVNTHGHGEGTNGKLPGSDSVYTILIRIPGEMENKNASIRMIQEPGPLPPLPAHAKAKLVSSNPSEYGYSNRQIGAAGGTAGHTNSDGAGGIARRPSAALPPLNAKVIPKPLTSKSSAGTISSTSTNPSTLVQQQMASTAAPKSKKKRKNQEKKQEKKAAKTLSAILLTFIVTWTPYNILVLLRTVLEDEAIPELAWNIVYYLCYINSTINPMCYALCNASFRRTYVRILTCKWDNSKRQAVNRGFYN